MPLDKPPITRAIRDEARPPPAPPENIGKLKVTIDTSAIEKVTAMVAELQLAIDKAQASLNNLATLDPRVQEQCPPVDWGRNSGMSRVETKTPPPRPDPQTPVRKGS